MLGQTFYHQTIRKYVALFGTLFNDINIEKKPFNLINPYLRLKDYNRDLNIYDMRITNEKS